ncbi:MAG: addiction module toxin, HicA family [Dehalococcoidia bacterium]|nr:type II toxin-antitoxin system HicA family toxin [Chloroflexota bacterium]MXY88828.1 addiction module toxin, HicA family [Dehalococcoidia bacterium]MXZ89152.1 addiction module toxin, HicA family [Dehalococcoidia bacterium]MYH67948.1 addiction module toxin, HicA family [Dehalococcoidia bacterium]MYI85860.1 addiction module toxin, HicA family [Dehalococcoidia bacterium]
MSRIPPATFRELDGILRRLGFESRQGKGSHVFYRHPDGRTTTVPDHRARQIGPSLIRSILSDINLTRDEYLAARQGRFPS